MIKNVHLGIFINEFGEKPYLYRDLKTFDDAIELDRFMDYYHSSNLRVRKVLEEDISEYFIDNISQIKHVEEESGKKFNGRLCAFYYDANNRLQFLELPKTYKIVVRDYRMIPDYQKCVDYLWNLFDETVEKINKIYDKTPAGPTKGVFVGEICEKFRQCSYEFSDEEIPYLVAYYYNQSRKNRDDCFTLIRTNVRRFFLAKAIKEKEEEQARIEEEKRLNDEAISQKEEELTYSSNASEEMQYDIERVKKTNDYEHLYENYDLDEIDKYTNELRRGRR